MERNPESSKEFLKELKKTEFDLPKAKDSAYEILSHKGGYRLTKAEALYKTGKLNGSEDVNEAQYKALTHEDVDAFMDQYGGDKYLKRLYQYGLSKMKRDFLSKRVNFESDKKKKGAYEPLGAFKSFDEAFENGFYGEEFNLSMAAIIEKGLTVSEYRQRDKRLKKIRKLASKITPKPVEETTTTTVPIPTEEVIETPLKPLVPANEAPQEQKVEPQFRKIEVPTKGLFSRALWEKELKSELPGFHFQPVGGEVLGRNNVVVGKLTQNEAGEWDGFMELSEKFREKFQGQRKLDLKDPENRKLLREMYGTKTEAEQSAVSTAADALFNEIENADSLIGRIRQKYGKQEAYKGFFLGTEPKVAITAETTKETAAKAIEERLVILGQFEKTLYTMGGEGIDPRGMEASKDENPEIQKAKEASLEEDIAKAKAAFPEIKEVSRQIGALKRKQADQGKNK